MREIKFRGFDEENNCWRYGWYTRLVEGARAFDAIICFEDDGVLTRYYIHDDSTISQFTGLHDKNGVEIYEGDIFTSDYFDDTYNFEVVFSDGAFCGKHKSTGIYMLGFTNFDDNGEDLGYWCEEDYTSHIQIIGNIHDNTELLSDKKS